jgi:hypothetical protein
MPEPILCTAGGALWPWKAKTRDTGRPAPTDRPFTPKLANDQRAAAMVGKVMLLSTTSAVRIVQNLVAIAILVKGRILRAPDPIVA